MKTRKITGRIAALFLAIAMLAALTITPAFAVDETVTITKNILKDENAYAPNTTFTFTVTPTTVAANDEDPLTQTGLTGGVYFEMVEGEKTYSGTITSTPKATDIGETSVPAGTVALQVDETVFANAAPGIYRYTVTEAEGEYDGLIYTDEVKYFDVIVTIGDDGAREYSYMFTTVSGDSYTKDDGIFENDYNDDTTGANKTLTVQKTVSGSMADRNKDFTFTITINGETGEQYLIKKGDTTWTVTSGEQQDITLKPDEEFVVYGLSLEDTYIVNEADYSDDGYTTTVTIDGTSLGTTHTTSTGDAQAITGDSDTVVFNNALEGSTPTGIVTDIAPYALMVVVAVAALVLFLGKRRDA